MADKFVLQHDISGTIHQLRKDGRTWCGKKRDEKLKRRRISKALEHPKAHHCRTTKKCGAHE